MTVLNRNKDNIPPEAVYIGRGTMWGNSFVIGVDGTRDEACEAYAKQLKESIRTGEVTVEQLASLNGKDLVCYCAPLRCHGDTLARVAAWAQRQISLRDNST